MTEFLIEPLAPAQSRLVFPLIREALPDVTLAAWQHFARGAARGRTGRGIVVARRPARPYPIGLFCYREQSDLRYGRVLAAEHVIAVDILDARPVLDALLRELDRIAARLGCRAVQANVQVGPANATACFVQAGHQVAGALLSKPLR